MIPVLRSKENQHNAEPPQRSAKGTRLRRALAQFTTVALVAAVSVVVTAGPASAATIEERDLYFQSTRFTVQMYSINRFTTYADIRFRLCDFSGNAQVTSGNTVCMPFQAIYTKDQHLMDVYSLAGGKIFGQTIDIGYQLDIDGTVNEKTWMTKPGVQEVVTLTSSKISFRKGFENGSSYFQFSYPPRADQCDGEAVQTVIKEKTTAAIWDKALSLAETIRDAKALQQTESQQMNLVAGFLAISGCTSTAAGYLAYYAASMSAQGKPTAAAVGKVTALSALAGQMAVSFFFFGNTYSANNGSSAKIKTIVDKIENLDGSLTFSCGLFKQEDDGPGL